MTSGFTTSPIGRILPRHASTLVSEALSDTRVVLINGARQCGKSTMVAGISRDLSASWRSLDRADVRAAAEYDPTEFVAGPLPMVIDEIQRVPQLLLAIKEFVDADATPGQFLLTGSARILGLRTVADALPGRMETIELWPLAQGEIDGGADTFVDAIFARGADYLRVGLESRTGYADRVVRGGFPEAVARTGGRRARFFASYVADLINRDVMELAEIERSQQLMALLRLIVARSGQLLVVGTLANELGMARSTVERYTRLLEEVFLIKRLPAWSRNLSARAVATPKVFAVDSGVAAHLLGFDRHSLQRSGEKFGALLEGFVLSELARQLTWSDIGITLSHYRTKDRVEVDAVLENRRGEVVAIEVKAASTVRADDFRGLRHLAERVGDDLLVGIVFYTGTLTLPFGPKFRAVPIDALWA